VSSGATAHRPEVASNAISGRGDHPSHRFELLDSLRAARPASVANSSRAGARTRLAFYPRHTRRVLVGILVGLVVLVVALAVAEIVTRAGPWPQEDGYAAVAAKDSMVLQSDAFAVNADCQTFRSACPTALQRLEDDVTTSQQDLGSTSVPSCLYAANLELHHALADYKEGAQTARRGVSGDDDHLLLQGMDQVNTATAHVTHVDGALRSDRC
jgi:hypothetical protein